MTQGQITCDPGKVSIGWALWTHRRLSRVVVSRGSTPLEHWEFTRDMVPDIHQPRLLPCYIEGMTARGAADKTPPQILIELSQITAAVAGTMTPDVRWLAVHLWKTNLPKKIHQPRFLKALSQEERKVLEDGLLGVPKSMHKEAYDAVGIGLKLNNRTDKAGRRIPQ